MTRRRIVAAYAALAILAGLPAGASAETLFKFLTAKDGIIVGLNDAELQELMATPARSRRRSRRKERSACGSTASRARAATW